MLLVERNEVAVLEIRMVLDLVNRRHYLGRLKNGLEMLLEEIGNSNGLGSTRSLDGLQISPPLLQFFVVVSEERTMDQIKINII